MPQDAFTLRLSAKELNEALSGGKISKIIQPGREEVAFYIYTRKGTLKLLLNVNASDCGIYFTDDDAEAPLVAPNFCMLMRKHLQNAEIRSVSLIGFERIVRIRLACKNDFVQAERELLAEIMGKYSNLVLVENGVILGALKTTLSDLSAKRMILAGVKYSLPAAQDKCDPSDKTALEKALSAASPAQDDLADFLFSRVAGLAPHTARLIAQSFQGGNLAEHVHRFIFSEDISPRVGEKDFYAREKIGTPFATLSEAQSAFYSARKKKRNSEGKRRALAAACSSALKKHEKRLAQTREKREQCRDHEILRIKGELITANLYKIERGMKGVALENYYDGGTLKIALDPALSPAQNAQNYFKRYRKQKRALEFLEPQEQETLSEIEYLQSLAAAISSATDDSDLISVEAEMISEKLLAAPKEKKRKTQEISWRTYEKDGFTILAGRNNLQNEKLVRAASPNDLWFHAQKYHSCHVIVKTDGKKVPESVLLYAAGICAHYSDGGAGKLPVDYCKVKYVKKPPKSKPGFVIYTDYKTILVENA